MKEKLTTNIHLIFSVLRERSPYGGSRSHVPRNPCENYNKNVGLPDFLCNLPTAFQPIGIWVSGNDSKAKIRDECWRGMVDNLDKGVGTGGCKHG